jgi:glutamate dehydrogenase
VVNRVGASFVHRLTEISGAKPAQIVRGYLAMREVFGHEELWRRIEALDNQAADEAQSAMLGHIKSSSVRATNWFLHTRRLAEPLQQLVERLRPAIAALRERAQPSAAASLLVVEWTGAGVPADLAQAVAGIGSLFDALDIAEIAEATQHSIDEVSKLHFELGAQLGLRRLHQQIDALPADGFWDNLAKIALGDDLAGLQRVMAFEVLNNGQGDTAHRLQAWQSENRAELDSVRRLLGELAETKAPADLAMLSVALRKLRNLA